MKSIRWGLLRYLFRQALPATAVGTLGLGLFALLRPSVLSPRDAWPVVVIFAQSFMLAVTFGRFEWPSFAFTYSRGYSRDSLWGHLMLAGALSVLTAWLVAGLMLWTGLRNLLHDRLLRSPYFPIMAPREMSVPMFWLGLYVLLVPALHYAWIRRAQPAKGRHGGNFVVIGLLAALLVGSSMVRSLDAWLAWLSGVLYAAVVVGLILGGRALHRSLEVRA